MNTGLLAGLQTPETCNSGRVGIRTPNLLIRSQVLYPIELRNLFLQKQCLYSNNSLLLGLQR